MYYTIGELVKFFRKRNQWQIDVLEVDNYDENGDEDGSKVAFKVERWNNEYSHYYSIAEFDTINEAFDFVRKYKSFPISADEVV